MREVGAIYPSSAAMIRGQEDKVGNAMGGRFARERVSTATLAWLLPEKWANGVGFATEALESV